MAHPGGRPSKLTEEVLDKAKLYLKTWQKHDKAVPSQVGLARYLGVVCSTVKLWAATGKEEEGTLKSRFSAIFEEIGDEQHKILVENGLLGDFNSTITKVMLTKHGHSDKIQTELTGKDGDPLQVTIPPELLGILDKYVSKD